MESLIDITNVAGVTLTVEPVSPGIIREYSNMTRSLCVQLSSVGEGLERYVTVDIDFVPQGYSQSSKLCFCFRVCLEITVFLK